MFWKFVVGVLLLPSCLGFEIATASIPKSKELATPVQLTQVIDGEVNSLAQDEEVDSGKLKHHRRYYKRHRHYSRYRKCPRYRAYRRRNYHYQNAHYRRRHYYGNGYSYPTRVNYHRHPNYYYKRHYNRHRYYYHH